MMMNREDKFISKKVGKANPFTVPEGYFDSFASQLMDSLPERKAVVIELQPQGKGRYLLMRRVLYVAACLCVAIFGASAYWAKCVSQQEPLHSCETSAQVTSSESYVEQVADYTMMDNSDIYSYLSSNDQ